MSNMLYACSILYKTKLPMILVFNKTDVQPADFAHEWMTDFEKFQDALREEEDKGVFGGEGHGGSGYMSSLLNSMSLMLEEFYAHLSMVGVSAMTGEGVEEFFQKVEEKRMEFNRDYKPELERRRKEREQQGQEAKQKDLTRFMEDMSVDGMGKKKAAEQEEADDDDDEMDPDDYPDAEREEPDMGLKQRYERALREGRIEDPGNGDMAAALKRAA
jgi:GPN-loop GTPase